jgi:hypothetical protein
MPELIPELREEARAVLNTHGTFTTQAIQDLKKMDSFLRENSRVYPLALSMCYSKTRTWRHASPIIPSTDKCQTHLAAKSSKPSPCPTAKFFRPAAVLRCRRTPLAMTRTCTATHSNSTPCAHITPLSKVGTGSGRLHLSPRLPPQISYLAMESTLALAASSRQTCSK